MLKPMLGAACAAALLLAGSAIAQPTLQPPGHLQPHANTTLPTPHIPPVVVACTNVDPSITNVYLTKHAAPAPNNTVQVRATIVNVGANGWSSGANQQNVTITVHNNNTNHSVTVTQLLPATAAAGATMLTAQTDFIPNAFDNLEFSGWVDVRIGYDPDILLDSNTCNDDHNSDNNHSRIEADQVRGFMGGAALTQAWHH